MSFLQEFSASYKEDCFGPTPVAGRCWWGLVLPVSSLLPLITSACPSHRFSSLDLPLTNLSHSAVRACCSSFLSLLLISLLQMHPPFSALCQWSVLPSHSLTGCMILSKSVPLQFYWRSHKQPFQFCYSILTLFCLLKIFQFSQVYNKMAD